MAFQSRLLPADVIRRLCYYRRAGDAVEFAHTHLDGPVRLDDVAAHAGMSTTAFSRYFAAKIGMTYSNVVKILRIERALGWLETQDTAFSDVAEQIGYQSCCTFSRAFKSVMGQTPSEYRRLILLGAERERAMIVGALDLHLSEGARTDAVMAAAAIGDRLLQELKDIDTDTMYEERAPSRGFGSSSGYAVLYAALVQATGEQRFKDAMHAHIRAAASLGDRPGIGVHNGMSGLRAALAYISLMEPGAGALLDRCDAYVDGFAGSFDANAQTYQDYDLLFGWAGVRLARCMDGRSPHDCWSRLMVQLLEDESHWLCPHPLKPDAPPEHSLGFAHGATGVATALALTLDEIDDAAAAAMTRALDFVISYKQVRSSLITWPHTAQDPEPMRFRAAWCFGSAGVALALAQCGARLQNGTWLDIARATLDSMLDVPVELWELGELNLCHGKIGIALIFRRASELLGDQRFFERAEQLVSETVAELRTSHYRQITHGYDGKRFDSLGTLTGIAGIALGLLDFAGAADGRWKSLYGIGSL